MTLARECIRPMVVTKGSDQVNLCSQLKDDSSALRFPSLRDLKKDRVITTLLITANCLWMLPQQHRMELSSSSRGLRFVWCDSVFEVVGSYHYMEDQVTRWHEQGIIKQVCTVWPLSQTNNLGTDSKNKITLL